MQAARPAPSRTISLYMSAVINVSPYISLFVIRYLEYNCSTELIAFLCFIILTKLFLSASGNCLSSEFYRHIIGPLARGCTYCTTRVSCYNISSVYLRCIIKFAKVNSGSNEFHVAPVTKTDLELRRVMTYTKGLEDGIDLLGFCSSYRPH